MERSNGTPAGTSRLTKSMSVNELIKELIGSMNIISIKILAGTKRWEYSISEE